MRRFLLGACSTIAAASLVAVTSPGCGSDDDPNADGGASSSSSSGGFNTSSSGGPKPGCINLECEQLPCETPGVTTQLSGTVFDPAGKVPVYNAIVYVPNLEVKPIIDGAACDRCDAAVSGNPVAITSTNVEGKFTLDNVPIHNNLPLVIQIGKWRRQVLVPTVSKCANTAVDASLTRLPRNRGEGNIPRMAVATGAADPLQCLLRKIGLDEAEFGIGGTDARVHLYAGGGFTDGSTPKAASKAFAAGPAFATAESLWNSKENLKKYDVVIMSCEGTENDDATHKAPAAKQAVYDYAKEGGRVFTTHFHHTFWSSSPDAAPKGVAKWVNRSPPTAGDPRVTNIAADIVGTFPKAVAMKEWLAKQQALDAAGKLTMIDAHHNVDGVNAGGLNWIEATNAGTFNPGDTGLKALQYISFNAPVGAPDDQICGRIVFTNLHVGAGTEGSLKDDPTQPFPASCQTQNLSSQQKALEFMLFDLSSCVQKDDAPVQIPR